MSAMAQVVWYIESHFMGEMTLDAINPVTGMGGCEVWIRVQR